MASRFRAIRGLLVVLCAAGAADAFVGAPLRPAFPQATSPPSSFARRAAVCKGGGLVGRGAGRAKLRMQEAEGGGGVTIREGEHKVDGFRCHYTVAEPASPASGAAPLVLVHGFGISSAHFAKNQAALAQATGAPVYAVDLMGFGKSEKPTGIAYGEALWSWQVQELVQEVVKAPKVFLAGHSMGGYVCMNVAAQNQGTVAGLCLINPSGRYGSVLPLEVTPVAGDLLRISFVADIAGRGLLAKTRERGSLRGFLEGIYADKSKVTDALLDAVEASADAAVGPELYASLFNAERGRRWDQLMLEENKGYMGPVLGLWGDEDPWVLPLFAGMLQDLRPDMQLEYIDAGHCPHDEKPDEVNAKLSEWMKKVAASPPEYNVFVPTRQQKVPLSLRSLF